MSDILNTSPLGVVRRFEAAGFRAWPATSVHYDGTWVIRITEGHSAKRLNSVNPLDPGDSRDLPERIARADAHFAQSGRQLVFRMSPLAGKALASHLDSDGWDSYSESLVMMMPLTDASMAGAIDHIPLKDVGRFVKSVAQVHDASNGRRDGLADIIAAIRPEAGLFALEPEDVPVATCICVHDGDLAGLFEVATSAVARGKGNGRRIVLSALKWARMRGAKVAWLQVEAANEVAIKLYKSLGFTEAYRYHYRKPAGRP
ncbi:MAG TPA: GNAT family N-acetyltransferase [Rhizobiaceae bacterium]|nr:GNAT family N-acetyltransferase [Rhizobiaceae bacterium]